MEPAFRFFFTNKIFSHSFFIAIITLTLMSGFKSQPYLPEEQSIEGKEELLKVTPFAVVELFTSEGCSSCPPADRLLTDIVKQSESNDINLFALSFHVDYWDYLGWKDPFARKEYTNRQRRYARALGSGVYTPQMVINGSAEFVGSNGAEANKTINYALNLSESPIKIEDISVGKKDQKVKVNFKTDGKGQGKVANIAIVEKDLSTDVKRGENRGRNLRHDNVVRLFKSIGISDGSKFETEVTLPAGVDTSKSSVIVYLQDLRSMEIFDAYGAKLSDAFASR